MENPNFSTDYWYYELCSPSESIYAPFDYMLQYIERHPGSRCFVFADHCTKGDIDAWLDNDSVKVYWWEDMTKTHATNPEDFEGLSDFIEALNDLLEPDFGAIIEIYLPVTVDEFLSIYYPANDHPAGEVVITNSDDLNSQIIQQFQATFGNDIEGEDVRPFLKSLYGGWVMFGYEQGASDREMCLEPGFRGECVTIPSYSDVDISSINWGILKSSNHTIF